MLHLKIKPFILTAQDWSGNVSDSFLYQYNSTHAHVAPCHNNHGNSNKLLELDEFTLGTL